MKSIKLRVRLSEMTLNEDGTADIALDENVKFLPAQLIRGINPLKNFEVNLSEMFALAVKQELRRNDG